MNPRIEKLKAEYARNAGKIGTLQERNRKLSDQIVKLENSDIIGIVREIGMTPEQLAELLSIRKASEKELLERYGNTKNEKSEGNEDEYGEERGNEHKDPDEE